MIKNSSVLGLLQWMLQIPGATSYIGCIGKDKFGEEMKKNSTAAGVNVGFSTFFPDVEVVHFVFEI